MPENDLKKQLKLTIMKTSDEQIDKIITDALSKEEAAYYEQLGEQNIIEMSLGVFQGKNRVLYLFALVFSFIIFGAFIYYAYLFYHAVELKDLMIYGAICMWCMVMIAGIKIWHWMIMNTNRILRELKRLELQLAAQKKA